MTVLVVIPTLNEAAHIEGLLDGLASFCARRQARVIVADGGSTDGTPAIVARCAARLPCVTAVHNPGRTQAAAVNLAVRDHAGDAEWLIRLDAHAAYPDDYCDTLLAEAARQGADSVVVSMRAVGRGGLHSAIADAQNARAGNGGSAHRQKGGGAWVDHGHHALMRIAAFRAVGGYDEAFTHNEDAELDHRLRQAGFRIWLTGETEMIYFPRRTIGALMRQYYRFGRGRAQNLEKHGMRPAPRQLAASTVAPAVALGVLGPLEPALALPAALWLGGCVVGGIGIAVANRSPRGLLSGFVAGSMHLAWSAGFWHHRLRRAEALA